MHGWEVDERIEQLLAVIEKDSENIRELRRIADGRNQRRDDLESDGAYPPD
jgi:hypothetical protein